MEILLIACMLAYAAGAQSEQSKLGLSPAQRATMREQTRHEKAVRKIAEKHGGAAAPTTGASPWKKPPATGLNTAPPATFLSGYRTRRPARPQLGHRAGTWAGNGVTWTQDAGRDAWRAYRKRRKAAGHGDPALALAPQPPGHPPMPAAPPTVGADSGEGKGALRNKPEAAGPERSKPAQAPRSPEDYWDRFDDWTGDPLEPAAADPQPVDQPAAPLGGVGRMAAEVTYESVMDESDELSIMCDDDVRVYDRIRERAEREIGRGDDLIAALEAAGFGPSVIGWVARCKENYGVIHSEVDDLQANTIAQGEAVVKAKGLLEAGQGVYADIAKDMEDVAERDAYISDAVDAEDASADTEVYETKAA